MQLICMFCEAPHCTCFRVIEDCPHCGTMIDNRYDKPVYGCLMFMLTGEVTCRLTTTAA